MPKLLKSTELTGDFTANPDQFFIDKSSGFIGIGETNPLSQLHIADSSSNTSGIKFTTVNGGTNDAVNIHNHGSQPFSHFYISRKSTGGA